ncbi:MAG: GIN domain-containing protein, partial [Anaerolineales bacterium]
DITTPRLSKLELSGSSHAHFDGYQSNQPFEANLTGSSSLTGEMQLDAAKLNTYGSSYVKLGGAGANLALETCGANLVDLSEFYVEDAALEVSCNSTVVVNVAGRLETEASQHAQVTFAGDPAVKVFNVHESATVKSK